MNLDGRDILILGGGIAGLSAALCLRRLGANVAVLEQADEISEVGAGLQITPNGVAVLRALGLEDGLARNAVRARAVVLRGHARDGEVLRLDLDGLAPGQHYYFVHRTDLIDLLAGAARAAGVKLRLRQRVRKVLAGPEPAVHLASGAAQGADLVVGADGLHSMTRAALNGAAEPFFTGQAAWRALVPGDGNPLAEATVHMGPGRHMVSYPLRGGKLVNIVAVRERADWTAEGWHHRDDPANLRAAFAGFSGAAADLLARVEEVGHWGLFRHPVAERWHQGRVAILGDAAHPTLPFMAQGANMALEDAWVLGDALDRAETVGEALAAYQARRRDRVVKVVAAANGNAWKYHLPPGPVRATAHLALRIAGTVAPGQMLRRFDWIYGHDVTA